MTKLVHVGMTVVMACGDDVGLLHAGMTEWEACGDDEGGDMRR